MLGVDLRHGGQPGVAALRRRAGLLGHSTALYDDLTVAENVRFWCRAAGATVEDADEAMDLLGLDDRLASVPVAKLSAGQRRRTALAVVVARRPELWLLDEPHAGLDQSARGQVDRIVRPPPRPGPPWSWPRTSSSGPPRSPARVVTLAGGIVVDDRPGGLQASPPRPRRRRTPCPTPRRSPVFRDAVLVAGEGPAGRGQEPGDPQPGGPARVPGARAVRLRPRSRQRHPGPGRRPGCSGSPCCSPRCSPSSGPSAIESADANRDALRLSGLDGGGRLPRQGGRGRRPAPRRSRCCCSIGVFVLYGVDIDGAAAPRPWPCSSSLAWPRPPGWPPPVLCTPRWPPGSGCGRRCSRSFCSRCWRRCSSGPPGPSSRRCKACPARAGRGWACSRCSAPSTPQLGVFAFGALLEES